MPQQCREAQAVADFVPAQYCTHRVRLGPTGCWTLVIGTWSLVSAASLRLQQFLRLRDARSRPPELARGDAGQGDELAQAKRGPRRGELFARRAVELFRVQGAVL